MANSLIALSLPETNMFDNMLVNYRILHNQGLPLAASNTSTEALFKQLWFS